MRTIALLSSISKKENEHFRVEILNASKRLLKWRTRYCVFPYQKTGFICVSIAVGRRKIYVVYERHITEKANLYSSNGCSIQVRV